jgi:hypothetical protein
VTRAPRIPPSPAEARSARLSDSGRQGSAGWPSAPLKAASKAFSGASGADVVPPERNGREPGLLPVGTVIRFLTTLVDGPDEHGPGNLYARAGDLGRITGHGAKEGYWVTWQHWPHPFGASCDEFEIVEPQQ